METNNAARAQLITALSAAFARLDTALTEARNALSTLRAERGNAALADFPADLFELADTVVSAACGSLLAANCVLDNAVETAERVEE